jgi:hypothetical protein
MTDWFALLDAIDQGLDEFPPVLLDDLPPDPGPVPPALAERAARTLQRMRDVEAALEHERSQLARDLSALKASTTATAGAPVPHFLDTKA